MERRKNVKLITPDSLGEFVTKSKNYEAHNLYFHSIFKVNKIEDFVNHMYFPLETHRKPVYDFIYITSGNVKRVVSGKRYEIYPQNFFFLPAYHVLESEIMSLDTKGYYCHFDISLFEKSDFNASVLDKFDFLRFDSNPLVKISKDIEPRVIYILERLMLEYEYSEKVNFSLITSYLMSLFFEITHLSKSKEIRTKNMFSITQSYKKLLWNHICEFDKVNDYANILAVSPAHLNRCVKATIGKTAVDLLNEILIQEAKFLLTQTSLTISEIAFKLCKRDPSDFSRLFKSKTGVTPSVYRDAHK